MVKPGFRLEPGLQYFVAVRPPAVYFSCAVSHIFTRYCWPVILPDISCVLAHPQLAKSALILTIAHTFEPLTSLQYTP
jgi:hypothetical protein